MYEVPGWTSFSDPSSYPCLLIEAVVVAKQSRAALSEPGRKKQIHPLIVFELSLTLDVWNVPPITNLFMVPCNVWL